ncbi:hypothetical protein F4808DRAFT_427823 [Astrocystis sublimbata]|nr:hypothetical protein F4808DRAFT_427823 [Astrocystis sublimbata]
MDKKKKLVFQLDTPFSAVGWPDISPQDQETILQLLCNLLSPLGHYRSQHIRTSRGKRSRKRKYEELSDHDAPLPTPPAPELKSYVDLGLSSVTRSLQTVSPETTVAGSLRNEDDPMAQLPGRHYAAIFVARSGQPSVLSSHLPQMVAVACQSRPSQPPTRLVELPRACEGQLYEALGIPRVSCIGICCDAPNSNALIEFIREHVSIVEAPWLQEAHCATYRATKINLIEASMGAKKKSRNITM